MTLDGLELQCVNFGEFHMISDFGVKTAKQMKTDSYCERQNCIPLNVLFSDVCITFTLLGFAPLWVYVRIQCVKMAF